MNSSIHVQSTHKAVNFIEIVPSYKSLCTLYNQATVASVFIFYEKKLEFVPNTGAIMTWGGLRGGISIALALSLTPTMDKDPFLVGGDC